MGNTSGKIIPTITAQCLSAKTPKVIFDHLSIVVNKTSLNSGKDILYVEFASLEEEERFKHMLFYDLVDLEGITLFYNDRPLHEIGEFPSELEGVAELYVRAVITEQEE